MITGVLYVIVAGTLFGILGNVLGNTFSNDLSALANAFATMQPLPIVFGIIGFIILGSLVYVFGMINIKIHNLLGENQSFKFGKRPFFVTLFAVGIVTSVIFYAFSQLLNGFVAKNVDVLQIDSLVSAIMTFNPMFIVLTVIGFAGLGYLISKISQNVKVIDDKLPDTTKRF